MLGSEGNENGKKTKTTIGLTSRKATLHVQHFFLYICVHLCTVSKVARAFLLDTVMLK